MTVSPALLDGALNDPQRAIDMVNTFSHSLLAPPPSALGPGTWLYGSSRALMRRVLASNREANVFHIGFKACDDYANGEAGDGEGAMPGAVPAGRGRPDDAAARRPHAGIAKAPHAKVGDGARPAMR